MARGDNPRRTPLYGGLLIIAAMLISTAVTVWSTPGALRGVVYGLSVAAVVVGGALTLRDGV